MYVMVSSCFPILTATIGNMNLKRITIYPASPPCHHFHSPQTSTSLYVASYHPTNRSSFSTKPTTTWKELLFCHWFRSNRTKRNFLRQIGNPPTFTPPTRTNAANNATQCTFAGLMITDLHHQAEWHTATTLKTPRQHLSSRLLSYEPLYLSLLQSALQNTWDVPLGSPVSCLMSSSLCPHRMDNVACPWVALCSTSWMIYIY